MDVTGYLERLGCPAEPPGLEALTRLHAAHVERVPYESLEIQLERPTSLDPAESLGRILAGRGGYCFHLNGAFSALLKALGYQVTRHTAGVQDRNGLPNLDRNHLGLTVTGLPDSPDTAWLVDTGLGDGLHHPIPLREGTYEQFPHTYRLRPSEVAPGGWRFEHDDSGSFLAFDFSPAPATMADFTAKHEWLSNDPESGFVRVCTIQRRDAKGIDILRARTLIRRGEGEKREFIESPADWWAAAGDVFGIPADGFTADERAELWRKVVAQHETHAGEAGSEVVPSA